MLSLEAEPNPFFRTAVLDACVKSLQQRVAWQVFNEMPIKTVAAYNSLIALQGRLRRIEAAEDLLQRMQDNCLQPDFVTYTTMITAYGSVHDVEKALGTLQRMKAEGMPVDRVAYGAAMSSCAKAGDKESTWKLLHTMDAARLEVDVTHLTNLIVSCARSKDLARAREALMEMKERGVARDSIVYTAFVNCIPLEGKQAADAAVEVLREMESVTVPPDIHVYNAAIRVAASVGAEDRLQGMLAEMKAAGLQPNHETEVITSNFHRSTEEGQRQQQQQQPSSNFGSASPTSQPPLPAGWASAMDPATGRAYFWSKADPAATTTWERPEA